jgi:glycerophosphoryl diester phosphodiesterase
VRSVVVGVIAGAGALLGGCPVQAQWIVAHRGASHDAPENTLAAFQLAWEQGADAIEGDFHLTRDGRIVCIHDEKTKRTSGEEHVVSASALDELRRLDVGRWKGARWAGERIPTLEEVLATVPAGKKIFMEIKCGPEIVPALKATLKNSGLRTEQAIVISFHEGVIAAVRRELPEFKAYWLAGFQQNKQTKAYEPSVETVFQSLERLRPHGLDVQGNRDVVNEAFVRRLRDMQLEFHVWTINDPEEARYFQALGVDSITTDRPGSLRRELHDASAGRR